MQVNMHQAKTDLSKLVARVLAGEEITIMRAGKPVARLVPIHNERVPGIAKGKFWMSDDFDAPLPSDLFEDKGVCPGEDNGCATS